MSLFNINDYEQNKDKQLPLDESLINKELEKEDVNKITVNISGSISEIVAKSLYELFPNTNNISTEDKINNKLSLSIPYKDNKDINILTLTKEEINTNPVRSLRFANESDSIVYIETNKPFSTAEENWFLFNIKNTFHLSIESLKTYIRKNI